MCEGVVGVFAREITGRALRAIHGSFKSSLQLWREENNMVMSDPRLKTCCGGQKYDFLLPGLIWSW